ncbi:hypothetical protein [Streptomyces sp. SID2888]|uniref:hypothetical protein n=1 Tax=Streptomyces sp. SID2888 TaxID=2690256 RepID=UPI001371E302|nr:hypothetical protein [Streptomyces sp. SID2888]MYV44476.1 hypothetical protein [Streptomyces sp. SID2888]
MSIAGATPTGLRRGAAVALAMPAGDPYAVQAAVEAAVEVCAYMTSRAKQVRDRVPVIAAEFTTP